MNINKYIAQAGLTSRRGADELIKAGKVKINENVAKPIDKVKDVDVVSVDGQEIQLETEKIYLIFYKPVGVITTTDANSPNNIIEYIKYPKRVFPVGRLDVNTSGLIILTNDGDFAQLIEKGKKIEKEYEVQVDKTIDNAFLRNLEHGIKLDGYPTLPAKTRQIGDREFTMTIREGRNRQVRRMCEHFGYNILKLKRIRIGNLTLDGLKEGQTKEITPEQAKALIAG
jgi:23S rRNA pseudouridine2604 synthase